MHLHQEQHTIAEENVFQKTVVNLVSTYHWCNHKLKNNLAPYNITVQQYHVLRILADQHPAPSTVNVIKLNMLDKMSDASRIIDRLIQKGLVRKTNSQSDKRAADITLTERALPLLAKIDQKGTLSGLISTHLTGEEVSELNRLLDKLRGINAPL